MEEGIFHFLRDNLRLTKLESEECREVSDGSGHYSKDSIILELKDPKTKEWVEISRVSTTNYY